ncbi:MAG: translational GTPase TypA [Deltaproteobacteria bacterium]|nr:translational GTPase TypA [Deltaproteobacteria bacterium]
MDRVRNIGIIAHVDHGKTTLIDQILTQAGAVGRSGLAYERVMDSNDLERERGITILAKNTAIRWRDQVINIVDTPGHADFGGEVERILRMVDSVLLLVDACEGPMPQTRFVLKKSLALGLRPIVVINKIDRPDRQPNRVLDAVFDLFVALDAKEAQLDFPVIYASGRGGFAVKDDSEVTDDDPAVMAAKQQGKTLAPLLDLILDHVPPCAFDTAGPAQFQVATLDRNDFLGRIAIGRIYRGTVRKGDRLTQIRLDGSTQPLRVAKLMGFLGTERADVDQAYAGDIIALSGVGDVTVGETLCAEGTLDALPAIPVDEPTLSMDFIVNNSPFAGKEGRFVTTRHVRERLFKELESNVSLRIEETESPDSLKVSGRGTLSLSILIETMRREGYELQVSQPRVIVKRGADGDRLEPYEDVVCECAEPYSGVVIDKLAQRGADLRLMNVEDDGTVRMEFRCPSRGLIGYRSQFLTDTRGTGVIYHTFAEFGPWRGDIRRRQNGALVALEPTTTTQYGIYNLQDRGQFFLGPGVDVYEGQVIGVHNRDNDLVINAGREKKLTNIRSAGADEKLLLTPAKRLSLEEALEFIADDELVEVTPKSLRLRKRHLRESDRRRFEKTPSAAGA